jgi:general secretion pathway protein L
MSNFAIVRVNDKLIPEFLIQYNQSENIAQKSNVSSWTNVKQNNKRKLIILLPANLVFSSQVNIPSKNDEIIRQSIPFTIEEELASDIDLNHFAYKKIDNQDLLVSVINTKILKDLISELVNNDLTCESIYSEIYSCPHQKNMTTMCAIDDYVIVRDDKNGTVINSAMLNNYLKLSRNKQKVVFSQKELKLESNDNIITKVIDIPTLQAQTICSGEGVNLLQGEFSQKSSDNKNTNSWKKLSVLSIILMGSWLFINLFQILSLSDDIKILKESQKVLLSKIVPNISQTELNDPYSSLLSRLKLNEGSNKNNTKGFIQALVYIGKTLQNHPTIEIVSLRQRNSKLEVNLQASDVSSLNLFQQELEKTAYSMNVKTGTRDSNIDGFTSIITMEQL